MEHERFREWLQLAILEELGGEDTKQLRDHLAQCDMCRNEFHELQQLAGMVREGAVPEPSEAALALSREKLFDAIQDELQRSDSAGDPVAPEPAAFSEPRGFHVPLGRGFAWRQRLFGSWRPAFSGGAAMALGFLLGYMAFGRTPVSEPISDPLAVADHEMGRANVANVRFVNADISGGDIEIAYDLVRPVRLRASVDDARMQRMLAYTLLNEDNAGVRLQAVSAFDAAPGRAKDETVKQALISSLTSDPNPGVRRQSLLVLQKFSFDEDIKNACLSVLARDGNPGMRVAAINMLATAVLAGEVSGGEIYNVLKSDPALRDEGVLRTTSSAFIQEEH